MNRQPESLGSFRESTDCEFVIEKAAFSNGTWVVDGLPTAGTVTPGTLFQSIAVTPNVPSTPQHVVQLKVISIVNNVLRNVDELPSGVWGRLVLQGTCAQELPRGAGLRTVLIGQWNVPWENALRSATMFANVDNRFNACRLAIDLAQSFSTEDPRLTVTLYRAALAAYSCAKGTEAIELMARFLNHAKVQRNLAISDAKYATLCDQIFEKWGPDLPVPTIPRRKINLESAIETAIKVQTQLPEGISSGRNEQSDGEKYLSAQMKTVVGKFCEYMLKQNPGNFSVTVTENRLTIFLTRADAAKKVPARFLGNPVSVVVQPADDSIPD